MRSSTGDDGFDMLATDKMSVVQTGHREPQGRIEIVLFPCTTDILAIDAGAGVLRAETCVARGATGDAAFDVLATDKMSVVQIGHREPPRRIVIALLSLYDGHLVRRRWSWLSSSRKAR